MIVCVNYMDIILYIDEESYVIFIYLSYMLFSYIYSFTIMKNFIFINCVLVCGYYLIFVKYLSICKRVSLFSVENLSYF